jgi:hypothetical protein
MMWLFKFLKYKLIIVLDRNSMYICICVYVLDDIKINKREDKILKIKH